jgi:cytochrome P450
VLRPRVKKIVDRVLGSLGNASEADLVEELAYPMPVLGIPETMHGAYLRWSAAIAEFDGSPNHTVSTLRIRRMRCWHLPMFLEPPWPSDVATRRAT